MPGRCALTVACTSDPTCPQQHIRTSTSFDEAPPFASRALQPWGVEDAALDKTVRCIAALGPPKQCRYWPRSESKRLERPAAVTPECIVTDATGDVFATACIA